jgi:hypothetical protein
VHHHQLTLNKRKNAKFMGTEARHLAVLRCKACAGDTSSFSGGPCGISGTFNEEEALRLDQAFPLVMKQLELMLTTGELIRAISIASRCIMQRTTCKLTLWLSCYAFIVFILRHLQPVQHLLFFIRIQPCKFHLYRPPVSSRLSPGNGGSMLTYLLEHHYGLTLNDTPFMITAIEEHIDAGITLADAVNFLVEKQRTGSYRPQWIYMA